MQIRWYCDTHEGSHYSPEVSPRYRYYCRSEQQRNLLLQWTHWRKTLLALFCITEWSRTGKWSPSGWNKTPWWPLDYQGISVTSPGQSINFRLITILSKALAPSFLNIKASAPLPACGTHKSILEGIYCETKHCDNGIMVSWDVACSFLPGHIEKD